MQKECESESFLKSGFFWCLLHRKEVKKKIEEIKADNKRLQMENDGLVEYNKRLENQLRLKAIEIKKLQKELKNLGSHK